jgi:hypothetical protein
MKHLYAKMTFRIILVSFLALILIGCGESKAPGEDAALISLTSAFSELPADGKSPTWITALVEDSSAGEIQERTSVKFTTTLGTFRNGKKEYRSQTVEATGTVSVQLVSGTVTGTAIVTAETNGVSYSMEIKFYDPHKVGTISVRTGSPSIKADGGSQVAIIATVTGADENPEAGITVKFKTSLGSFQVLNPIDPDIKYKNTTATTDVDGEATVMLISGNAIGTAEILSSVDGLNASTSVTFTAGDAFELTLRAAPSTVKPSGSSNIIARLIDSNNNPISGASIVFSTQINMSEGSLDALSAPTDINGEAIVSYTTGKVAGADVIQARLSSDAGMNNITTVVVDPEAIVIGGITMTAGSSSLVADGASQVKIRAVVTDIDGNPAIGKTVTYSTTAGTLESKSVTTSDIGLAEVMLQSSTFAGPVTVRANCDGFIGEVDIEFVPGPADHILLHASPNIVPPYGEFNVEAIILDRYDNRRDTDRLTFFVTEVGKDEVLNSLEMTGDQAQANDGIYDGGAWTAWYDLDEIELTARVTNGVETSVIIQILEGAIQVGGVDVIAGASSIEANGSDTVTIRATVTDKDGAAAPGTTVNFSTTLGTLISSEEKTDLNGIAEVTLKSETVWGTATVIADANGFKGQVDVLFTTKATGLNVTILPDNITPGGQSSVIAELHDASGEPVPNELLYFDLYQNESNGFLSDTQAITDVNGRATVTFTGGVEEYLDCSICSGSDCIKVTLASDSSVSDTACVTVATPSGSVGYITLETGANTIPNDGSSTSVTATIFDTTGFPMPEGTSITFSTTVGKFPSGSDPDGPEPAGPINWQTTLSTGDDTGKVITSLISEGTGGPAEITAISGGVEQTIYVIIDDGSVDVGSILLTSADPSLPADGSSSTAITVLIKDSAGDPVPSGTPVVLNILDTGDAAFDPSFGTGGETFISLFTTGTSGTVTTPLIASNTAGVATITATAGSKTQSITVVVTSASTPDVGYLTLTAEPDEIAIGGYSTLTATAYDTSGELMPAGTKVDFLVSGGTGADVALDSVVTIDDSGKAITTLYSGTATDTLTVTASWTSDDTIPVIVTKTTTVVVTSASTPDVGYLTLTAEPDEIPIGGSSAVTATVYDSGGNLMPAGTLVGFIVTSGPGLISAATVVTIDATGKAITTFTSGTSGTSTITASSTSGGVTATQTTTVATTTTAIPQVGYITLAANPTEIPIGGSSAVTATVYDSGGNLMPAGTQVTFGISSGLGSLSFTSVVTIDATGKAITTFTSGATAGTSTIEASADSGAVSQVTTVATTTTAIPQVGYITLAANPTEIPIGGSSAVTATVYDAGGNLMPAGTQVDFLKSSGPGSVSAATVVTVDATGKAITTFTSATSGTSTISASSTSGGVTATQTTTVATTTTAIPQVGYITLAANPDVIPLNGYSAITAIVYDTVGDPMPAGTAVTFSQDATPLGTLSTPNPVVTADDTGTAIITFNGTTTGTATITATSGTVSQATTVGITASALPEVGYIVVTPTPAEIPLNGSSAITAIVYDTVGDPMPAGTAVTFSQDVIPLGTLSTPNPVVTADDTGTVIITFNGTTIGTATITATSGTVSQTTTVAVATGGGGGGGDEVAAIALVAAQDSILPEDIIAITAMVYDLSGHGLAGQSVVFTLDDPTLGFITTGGTTLSDGTFVATFEARTNTGTVNITATSGSVSSTPKAITIMSQLVDNIAITANPTSIIVTKTSTISAYVTDTTPAPVENGTTVYFTLVNSMYGTITSSATTNAGYAVATFTAANVAGTTRLVVNSGAASSSIDLVIDPAEAASIEFDSVSKNPIAIRGTGGQEFAIINFNVIDVNGNPANDIDVLFTMSTGISGDEYLEVDDTTPYTQVVSTSAGLASVTLHSGFEAGTVSINASITTASATTISATTPVISIGGGVPTDEWFSISVEEPGWNMGGLNCVGVETKITAWLADRFGNYNVLDGTTVSFLSEVGLAVYPTGVTDGATGTATSTVRTQSGVNSAPKDVVPERWETDLKAELASSTISSSVYGFGSPSAVGDPLPSGHPRDGVCNVLVFVMGEESFVDGSNGLPVNGIYDFGEDFTDTIDDPWRDYDDDGLYDFGAETTPLTLSGPPYNPQEEYQDRDGLSSWDGLSTDWDGPHPNPIYETKNIYRQVNFLITGTPFIRCDRGSFSVPNGGTATVRFLVCDQNYNMLAAGSDYNVTVSEGEIVGGTESFVYPSSSFYGSETTTDMDASGGPLDDDDFRLAHRSLIVNQVTVGDADPADTDPAKPATLTVTVTWKSNGGCGDVVESLSITGLVD